MVMDYVLIGTVTFEDVFSSIDFAAAILAGIGLFYTAKSIRKEDKTKQLGIAESLFKEIREIENKFYEDKIYKKNEGKKDWAEIFFNTLEWFSFLINKKKLSDKELIGFFRDAIIQYYDEIFCKIYDAKYINDETKFPEFKKLYKEMKSK